MTTFSMVRTLRVLLALLAVMVALGTTACSKEEPRKVDPVLNVDPVLDGVSGSAAYMKLKMFHLKQMRCIAAEVVEKVRLSEKKSDKGKSGADVVADRVDRLSSYMIDQHKNLCDLFAEVEKNTQPVFEQIKRDRKLPNDLYVFSVFLSTGDGSNNERVFAEEEVGLFGSKHSCETVEEFARVKNIPIRRCRVWIDITKLLDT